VAVRALTSLPKLTLARMLADRTAEALIGIRARLTGCFCSPVLLERSLGRGSACSVRLISFPLS